MRSVPLAVGGRHHHCGLRPGWRPVRAGALSAQDQVPDQYKVFTAALKAVEANYVGEVRVRPPGLQRHHRHAADARPAFELHGPAQFRADARASGRPLLRPRHHHQRGRWRRHRLQRLRGVTGVSEGPPARRRHRPDRRRDDQGLEHRAGRAQAARSEGHVGQHRDPPRHATTSRSSWR